MFAHCFFGETTVAIVNKYLQIETVLIVAEGANYTILIKIWERKHFYYLLLVHLNICGFSATVYKSLILYIEMSYDRQYKNDHFTIIFDQLIGMFDSLQQWAILWAKDSKLSSWLSVVTLESYHLICPIKS